MNDFTEYKEGVRKTMLADMPDDVLEPIKKATDSLVYDVAERIEWWLKDELAESMFHYVSEMASKTVESILSGNEQMVREYLTCRKGGYTGRDRDHPVIHGTLFETGGIQLRKQIVEAYADLLKTERMLDLEDQVKSLVEQVRKRDGEIESLRQRLAS